MDSYHSAAKEQTYGMTDWSVTAKTIYCDAVDDEVTLVVNRDKSARCTAYGKYGEPDRDTVKLLALKGKEGGKTLACEGPECKRLTAYRDALFSEEECL